MPSDSSTPDFWDTRFRDGVTPWDAGGVPPALKTWLEHRPGCMRVLIPGAGTGYEVRLFADRGDDVLAIDFSAAAIDAARRHLGPLMGRLRQTDFFAFPEKDFDLVYERAFLCALPRRLWPQWGARMAELVRPGGELAGFFYIDDNERGPPFGISRDALSKLRGEAFDLAQDQAVPAAQSLPVFKGKEIWQVWKRRL